jgi:cation diffusion facilitator CzcD-associated flavoprotein CzcO
MLQRSPSYVLSQPTTDGLEILIRTLFPAAWAHKLIRIKWLVLPLLFINFCWYFPTLAKKLLRKGAIEQLPPNLAHDPHFKPRYNPFQQRMCFCPDGDFYAALRTGKASVVTGAIERVTEKSIKLTDGQELHPDIIVTATGLKLCLAGGVKFTVDNQPFALNEKFIWKTVMMQDLPNTAFVIGYVDASWTLGADATAQLICRLLRKMEREGARVVVPRLDKAEEGRMKVLPLLRLTSTYVQKGKDVLPKTADGPQWRPRTTYLKDLWEAKFGDLKTGMQYISTE